MLDFDVLKKLAKLLTKPEVISMFRSFLLNMVLTLTVQPSVD